MAVLYGGSALLLLLLGIVLWLHFVLRTNTRFRWQWRASGGRGGKRGLHDIAGTSASLGGRGLLQYCSNLPAHPASHSWFSLPILLTSGAGPATCCPS